MREKLFRIAFALAVIVFAIGIEWEYVTNGLKWG